MFTKNTAFNAAVAEWSLSGLQSALAADPALAGAEDATGCTALHLIARQRPAAIGKAPDDAIPLAEALLKAGADIDHVALPQTPSDTFCPTPLWQAIAWSRNHALARYLLEEGATPDGSLWAVVWSNDLDMARTLIAKRPDLELKLNGETPLVFAARNVRTDMVKLLIDSGADATARNPRGHPVLNVVSKLRYPPELLVHIKKTVALQKKANEAPVPEPQAPDATQERRAAIWQRQIANPKDRKTQLLKLRKAAGL